MIKALSRSLSLRLLGIFIVTAILIVFLLIAHFSHGLNSQWKRSIQPHLLQYVQYVQQDLGNPPDPDRAKLLAQKLPVIISIFNADEFVFSTNGIQTSFEHYRFKAIPIGNNAARRKNPDKDKNSKTRNPFRAAISTHDYPSGRILRIEQDGYLVYYDLHRQWNKREPRARYGDDLLIALAALAAIFGASYYLIRRQLAPISQIQNSVGRMSNGELEHRINRAGHGDLDELANSIDGMAARLQAMLDAKRQLLMAISHELRSPLTRARIATELLPESRNRERLEEDLHDMERMITDIMESEQLQTSHAVLNIELLDIVSLVRTEAGVLSPLTTVTVKSAQTDELRSFDTNAAVFIQGDVVRLRILLRNLVGNALLHGKNKEGVAHMTISLLIGADTVQLQVSDLGPGIASGHLAAVKEPFYRPDASRSRNTGGFGLGLTLANLIALAHGGSLDIDSDPENLPGTRVTVTLPRSHTE